jgi:hypothetical protein
MRPTTLQASLVRALLMLCLVLLLNGCAASRVTPVGRFHSIEPPLTRIALAPNGGTFADLLGMELAGQGYTIVDTGSTLALLVFMQKTPDDLLSPQVMAMLKQRGIDAVLVVQKVDGKNGPLQTVHIRLYSTEQVAEIGGIDWENGWIRLGVLEAAEEIATAMGKNSRPLETVIGDNHSAASPSSGGP